MRLDKILNNIFAGVVGIILVLFAYNQYRAALLAHKKATMMEACREELSTSGETNTLKIEFLCFSNIER